MFTDRHGTLAYDELDGELVLRFVRILPVRPRKAWRHLLDAAHLQDWLTNQPGGVISRRVGHEVFLPTATSGDILSEVTEFTPESVLAFPWTSLTFDGGDVRWTLGAAESGGTELLFEHFAEPGLGLDHVALSLATWHLVLDRFEASLAGTPVPMDYDQWEHHYGDYLERFLHMLETIAPPTAFQRSPSPE